MTAYSAEMLPQNEQIVLPNANEAETAIPKTKINGQVFPRTTP